MYNNMSKESNELNEPSGLDASKDKKVVISDLFIDIYKNFNVVNQVDRMKELSKKELYLLLLMKGYQY